MNINDDDLVNSKLLVAKIRIEVLSHGETELIYRCERTVDQAHVRIKMMEFTVSNLDRNWNIPLKSVSYVCTVRFEYHGKFDRITHKMEKLMASARSATAMGSNTLASMLDDKTFTDFTFNIRGQEFKVHKCVMSAASDVMKNLITLGGCGSGETKKNSANFDCDPEIFNHLINFIYKSSVPVDEMSKICYELYDLANNYEIKLLEKICMVFIEKIDKTNALSSYKHGIIYNNEKLIKSSWNFIRT